MDLFIKLYGSLLSKAYRVAPVVILIIGISKGVGKSKGFKGYSYTLAAQNELNGIARVLHTDSMSAMELPTPEQFADYIRKNVIRKENVNRDPATDMWGTGYQLTIEGRTARVSSAGPDKQFGTSDDIVAEARLLAN